MGFILIWIPYICYRFRNWNTTITTNRCLTLKPHGHSTCTTPSPSHTMTEKRYTNELYKLLGLFKDYHIFNIPTLPFLSHNRATAWWNLEKFYFAHVRYFCTKLLKVFFFFTSLLGKDFLSLKKILSWFLCLFQIKPNYFKKQSSLSSFLLT